MLEEKAQYTIHLARLSRYLLLLFFVIKRTNTTKLGLRIGGKERSPFLVAVVGTTS